jgi:phosphatidylserine/phosphatidylglycerophosphate/cardiolipin synthase-like enzyme
MKTRLLIIACLLATSSAQAATAEEYMAQMRAAVQGATGALPQAAAPAGSIEVGFSDHTTHSAEALVLKAIGSAHSSIKIAAYSFTSATVTQALLNAIHRGVQVWMIVDMKNNLEQSGSRRAVTAFNALAEAGAHINVVGSYPIHHNKFIVVDDTSVETGSFNYSRAAAESNAENALVMWGNPSIAAIYANEWVKLFKEGQPYQVGSVQPRESGGGTEF